MSWTCQACGSEVRDRETAKTHVAWHYSEQRDSRRTVCFFVALSVLTFINLVATIWEAL